MTDSLRNLPIIGQVAPDLYVQAQDWPDADKIAERVKRTIPPQIPRQGRGRAAAAEPASSGAS